MAEERRDIEEEFTTVFHSNPLPQTIGTFDEGHRIEVNQAFADLVVIPCETLLGHTTLELGLVVDRDLSPHNSC